VTAVLERPLASEAVTTRRRMRLAAPVLVGMLGLLISLASSTVPSVWYDEAATITAATRDWGQLWAMVAHVDAVHAAYYAIMHVVFDVVGYSPLSLRAPSAVAIGVAAALIVVLARLFDRPRLGVIAGIVFCLLPRTVWAGAEGRSYALTATLALVMTVLFVLAARSGSRAHWSLYALAVVASCLVFVYLVLIVLAHAATLAWWLVVSRRAALPSAWRWLGWTALTAIVVVPFVLFVAGQSGQVNWIDPPGSGIRRQILRTQWFMFDRPFAVVGWVLVAVGAVVLVRRSCALSLAAVALPLIVVPTLALLVVSVSYIPVYTPRYLTMCLPFVALAMGAAIDAVRPRLLALVPIVALVALAIPQFAEFRAPEAKDHSSWAEVADTIAADRAALGSPSTAIIYGTVKRHLTATSRVIAYAYPEAFRDTIDVTIDEPAGETGRLWESRIPLAEGLPRLDDADVAYLVTGITRDRRPKATGLLAANGWHISETWSFTWVNVVRYQRD
jgi:mannosyltransferase